MKLSEVNALSATDFSAEFGAIAEHNSWVAERAAKARPYADRSAMIRAFQQAILDATPTERLEFLRGHPDLAGRAAMAGDMTRESKSEQAGAGLGQLTSEEFARFTTLNEAYRARFEMPFILAVRGATKHQILAAFENRVGGTLDEELLTATAQVLRIVRFRLEDRVDAG